MSRSSNSREGDEQKNKILKYKGVRCRKWGKWVSEIQVPGTQDRLWLGSYTTPEAAAVAHDIASYCLRRPLSLYNLNFPLTTLSAGVSVDMSPPSTQKAASEAGMAVDAQFANNHHQQQISPTSNHDKNMSHCHVSPIWETSGFHDHQHLMMRQEEADAALNVSVEDYL